VNSHLCSVCVEEGLPWGFLATQALRLFFVSTEGQTQSRLRMKSLLIEGMTHGTCLSFGGKIDGRYSGHQLILVLEGSFSEVLSNSREVMLSVLAYLKPSPVDLATLCILDRKLSRVLENDEYWLKTINTHHTMWEGVGRDGSAVEEWLRYAKYFGLPIKNVLRIRHLNHTTSRIRLFYGTLTAQTSSNPSPIAWSALEGSINPTSMITTCITAVDGNGGNEPVRPSSMRGHHHRSISQSSWLGGALSAMSLSSAASASCNTGMTTSTTTATPSIVWIIGCHKNSHASRQLLSRIMLSLPASALFPLDPPPYKPLVKDFGGFLMQVEPSPIANLRQFRNKKDPGILVEGVSNNSFYRLQATMELRKIGDSRLSFVEFSHQLGGSIHVNDLLSTGVVDATAKAHLFVLDACKENEDSIRNTLEELINTYILGPFLVNKKKLANTASYYSNSSCHTQPLHHTRGRSLTLPFHQASQLLPPKPESRPFVIFVSINTSVISEREEIDAICQHVRRVTENILRTHVHALLLRTSKLKWFVQPYDELAEITSMRCGIGAGVNWLTRSLNASPASNSAPIYPRSP